jgi:hypothetical protein
MQLRVTAEGRCGEPSDRAATDKSVKGITAPGPCWAVDVKVERSNSVRLREGSITHYWGTKQDADADAAMIAEGNYFYKDTGRRCFDPVVVPARAYWAWLELARPECPTTKSVPAAKSLYWSCRPDANHTNSESSGVESHSRTLEDEGVTTLSHRNFDGLCCTPRVDATAQVTANSEIIVDPRGRYLADYGSEGWGFESLRARKKHPLTCRDASEGMFCFCRKSLHDTETTRIEGLVISPNSATEQFDRVASDELLEQLWVYSGSRAEVIREPSCVIASLKVDSGVLCVVANMTSRRIGLVMTCRSSTIRWSTSAEVHPSWLRTVREGRLRYPRPGNRQVLRRLGVWRHRCLGAPAPVCRFATRRQCRPP